MVVEIHVFKGSVSIKTFVQEFKSLITDYWVTVKNNLLQIKIQKTAVSITLNN